MLWGWHVDEVAVIRASGYKQDCGPGTVLRALQMPAPMLPQFYSGREVRQQTQCVLVVIIFLINGEVIPDLAQILSDQTGLMGSFGDSSAIQQAELCQASSQFDAWTSPICGSDILPLGGTAEWKRGC